MWTLVHREVIRYNSAHHLLLVSWTGTGSGPTFVRGIGLVRSPILFDASTFDRKSSTLISAFRPSSYPLLIGRGGHWNKRS